MADKLAEVLEPRNIRELTKVTFALMKKVHFCFNPFDPRAKYTKHFMQMARAPGLKATNPKIVIEHKLVWDKSDPFVEITFANDQKHKFVTSNTSFKKLQTQILYAESIERFRDRLIPANEEPDETEEDDDIETVAVKTIDPLKKSKKEESDA